MNSSFGETREYIYISEPQVECFYSEIVKSCDDTITANTNSHKKESKYESIIPIVTEEHLDYNETDIIHEIDEFDHNNGSKRKGLEDFTIKNENVTNGESEEILEGFRCHICSYLLPSSRTLRHHLVETHAIINSISYFCPLCEYEFWSEKQLNYHLNLHHGIKRADLACNVCGMELSSKSEVKAHQRKHILQYRCPSCSQKFGAKHLLLLHSQDHIAKLKPYACCLCGRRFKHVKAYFLHEWRHSKQSCPEPMCKSEFNDESYLLIHLQKAHKMKDLELKNIVSSKDELDRNIDFLLCLSSKKNIIKYIDVQNCNEDNYLLFYTIIETDDNAFMKKENWMDLKWKMCNDGELSYSKLCRLKEQLEEIVLNYNIKEEKSIFEDEAEVIELENLLYKRQSKHTCGLCGFCFNSFELYHNHLLSHKKTFRCHLCSKSYRSLKLLRRHCTLLHCSKEEPISSSDENSLKKCPECGKLCSSEKALHIHKELKHKLFKKPKCKICHKSFTTKGHLNEHLYVFHKDEPENVCIKKYECTICDKALMSEKNYELHMRIHDASLSESKELVSLSCPKCEKKFTRPQMLNRHFAQHETKHRCSVCNKSFSSVSKLSSHLGSHDQDLKRRFSCKQCNLKFAYKCLLCVHMLTHTGEKPYVCEKCGKKFKRLQQCKVHNKLVHSQKELQCKECLKFFGTESNLLRHRIAFHLNLKRWICGICSHSYAYSQDLRNHLKKTHEYVLKSIDHKSKKSNSDVYIIPELNSHKISEDIKQKIEFIHREESLKLKTFILNKDVPPTDKGELNTLHGQQNQSSYPVQNAFSAVQIQTTLQPVQLVNPLQPILIDRSSETIMNTSCIHKENIIKNRCNYCKSFIMNQSQEIVCDICSLVFCSALHLTAHSASHVLFQCSVCSVRFTSKDLCEIHIRNSHSYTSELQRNSFVMQSVNNNNNFATIPHLRSVLQNPSSVYQLIPVSVLNTSGGCQDHNYVVQRDDSKPVYQTLSSNSNIYIPQQTFQPNLINQQSLVILPNETMTLPVAILPSTSSTNVDTDKIIKSATRSTFCPVPVGQNQAQVIEANVGISNQVLIPSTEISDRVIIPGSGNSDIACGSGTSSTSNAICTYSSTEDIKDNSYLQKVESSNLFAPGSAHLKLYPDVAANDGKALVFVGEDQMTSRATSLPSYIISNNEESKNQDISSTLSTNFQGNSLSMDINKVDDDEDDEEEDEEEEEEEEEENEEEEEEEEEKKVDEENIGRNHFSYSNRNDSQMNLNNPRILEANSSKVFYKCRICDKLLPTLSGLERHNKIHEEKKFDCPQCQKSFVEKFNLKTHMLTHTKERPWQCNKCHKKFRYCRDLKDHLRAHEGLLLFQCSSCEMKFLRSRDLVRHKREQHTVVKYKCGECGQKFGRKYYLEKYHMKIHNKTSAKKCSYNCVHCSQVFTCNESLKIHKCSHDGTSFKCSYCDKTFNKKRSLSSHLRIHNLVKK